MENPTMAAKKRAPDSVKVLAQLREELLELVSDGMGKPVLSDGEKADLLKGLEETVADVFLLKARVATAKALGVLPWLVAEMTGQFPESFPGGPPDTE